MIQSRWTAVEIKHITGRCNELLADAHGRKLSRTHLLLEAQKSLPANLHYTLGTLGAIASKLWEQIRPGILPKHMDKVWGERAEASPPGQSAPRRTVELVSLSQEEELIDRVFRTARDRVGDFLIDILGEEAKIEVAKLMDTLLPKDKTPKSPSELRRWAQDHKDQPSSLRKPRVIVFGLHEHENAPKLNPFKKILDITFFTWDRTADAKSSAERSQYVLYMTQHITGDQLKQIRLGANSNTIPVHGGLSALEAALHTICVAHKIHINLSDKAHQEVKGTQDGRSAPTISA